MVTITRTWLVLSTAYFRTSAVKEWLEKDQPGLWEARWSVKICHHVSLLAARAHLPDAGRYTGLPGSGALHEPRTVHLRPRKGFTNKAFWQTLELAEHWPFPRDLKPYLKRLLPDLVYTAVMTKRQTSGWTTKQDAGTGYQPAA